MGGLGAFALLLVAILFVLRRHKRRVADQALEDAAYGGPLPATGASPETAERPGLTPLAAAAANFFGRGPRHTRQQSTVSEPTSEQGFYRVGGRKIEPVLGGPRPGKSLEAGHSLDDEGESATHAGAPPPPLSSSGPAAAAAGPSRLPGHPAAPSPVSSAGAAAMPATSRIQEEKEEEAGREPMPVPSPGRDPTPVPSPGRSPTAPSPSRPPEHYTTRPPLGGSAGRDGLGRSLPSHDGSRASKFTEDIV